VNGDPYRHSANRPIRIGQTENRHESAVAVIGRVVDELIMERGVREDAVLCFKDLLMAGILQLPVADNPAKAAGSEI